MSGKKMKRKFKPKPPLEAIEEIATGIHNAGLINQKTMREFNNLCIPEVKELSGKEIARLRLREGVSQPIFAKYLNTSVSTVKQWEIGEKHPRGTSLKLLNLVKEHGLHILGYQEAG